MCSKHIVQKIKSVLPTYFKFIWLSRVNILLGEKHWLS